VPDFALSRIVVNNVPVTLAREPSDSFGPEVLLCLNGEVTVSSDGGGVSLRGGQSAFLSPSASPTVLSGLGQVYRATVGRAPLAPTPELYLGPEKVVPGSIGSASQR
jgi:mannose-6-phosphate isomerase